MLVLRSKYKQAYKSTESVCVVVVARAYSKSVATMTRLTRWRDHADLIADHICHISNKAAPTLYEILQITDDRRSHGLHIDV